MNATPPTACLVVNPVTNPSSIARRWVEPQPYWRFQLKNFIIKLAGQLLDFFCSSVGLADESPSVSRHNIILLMPYANNKGTDQPAHPRSLISTFVVRTLDSIVPVVAVYQTSRL